VSRDMIVSLFGSIPYIGDSLVEWIRGDYHIADAKFGARCYGNLGS
jgi:quinol-cytochrome oxidoreductase complex cytochrome b subunit